MGVDINGYDYNFRMMLMLRRVLMKVVIVTKIMDKDANTFGETLKKVINEVTCGKEDISRWWAKPLNV